MPFRIITFVLEIEFRDFELGNFLSRVSAESIVNVHHPLYAITSKFHALELIRGI